MKSDFRFCLSLLSWAFFAVFLAADEFPFTPPKNFVISPQWIGLHHPVSTQNPLAQLYFDQGLTLIYAFNHDAAYWSFLKAIEADPEMAMGYWGAALALGSNINMGITEEREQKAYDFIQRGLQRFSHLPEPEKDYLQALSKRYSNDPKSDKKQRASEYSRAMRLLREKYPDDPDAATLFAESLLDLSPWNQWSLDGKPLPGTKEAIRVLASVLKKNPNHLGANHYYIHAVEASPYPEVALVSAERLPKLLPHSGHILHMPSHIYLLLGDYRQAALTNEKAVAADRAYIREYGIRGIYPLHYLSHNLYFLSRAYTMLGRFGDAKQAAAELFDFYAPHFEQMPELEYYASNPLSVLLTFHKWKELLALSPPPENMKMTHVLWHFGRAMGWASLGHLSRAEEEQRLFLQGRDALSEESVFGYNKAHEIFKIATYLLEAKLADRKGDVLTASESFRNAVQEQDRLHYNEPPDWFFSIREGLGGFLLRRGKPEEAEKTFREDLKKHPRSGRALFGLRESLRRQSKFYDFYWVDQDFQQAWMYGDTVLTVEDL